MVSNFPLACMLISMCGISIALAHLCKGNVFYACLFIYLLSVDFCFKK